MNAIDSDPRGQLSTLYSLFVLSTMMFDTRDESEIVRLAMTSVPSLGPCDAEGAYLVRDGELVNSWSKRGPPPLAVDKIRALHGEDGEFAFPQRTWGWAYALRNLSSGSGYLVVSAEVEPSAYERFLLRILAQQTAAAVINATQYHAALDSARELAALNDERANINNTLTATVDELRRQKRAHELLGQIAAAGEGEQGVARVLHELTGYPVAIEDQFGNNRAWAGPDRPEPYPKGEDHQRAIVLRAAASQGRPVRDHGWLVAPIQPRSEILGIVALVDPQRKVGPFELFALEHAAMVLALELAHQRALAEVELRLRRDLVDDLVTGTDEAGAYTRAAAVGHDLHGPHRVVAVHWQTSASRAAICAAAEAAIARLGPRPLVTWHSGVAVLLVPGAIQPADLYAAISGELGVPTGSIGIGSRCDAPDGFPRSFQESLRALSVRQASRAPYGITTFDDLGVYRLLGAADDSSEIERFVAEWLGPLIAHDEKKHGDLVETLSQYLECGGNYDHTAAALMIHRSTLRYRLQRIRDISKLDLTDVDSRLNLHVAARAWKIVNGSV